LVDVVVGAGSINVLVQMGEVHELLPAWTEWGALGLLGLIALAPLQQRVRRRLVAAG